MQSLSENYKLSEDLKRGLNDQMRAEFHSAYLYLSMSHFFAINNMPGFSHWFSEQSKEEYSHAIKFLDLFKKLRISPHFEVDSMIQIKWDGVKELLESTLNHEKMISGRIHSLLKLAKEEGTPFVCDLLKWFVVEQNEEENSVIALLDQYDSMKNNAWLVDMDRELLKRGD